ncbi:MAG TPA: glycosyltransferase [Pedobacter sp.]|jgi:hypothetical protein
MISIIISSAKNHLLDAVTRNIDETIGVTYEIISFDNSQGKYGICSVYNKCSKKAIYEIVCFLHEDIVIRTRNWGRLVIDIFEKNQSLGLLGVAGTSYQPFIPSGWGHPGLPGKILHYFNLIQHHKFSDKNAKHLYSNPEDAQLSKVATLDGVLLCTTIKVLEQHAFDEDMLQGFHGYDLDFSLSVNLTHSVAVTYNILIEHFSEGNFEKEWLYESIRLQKKWAAKLPLNLEGLTDKECRVIERRRFKELLKTLIQFRIPLRILFEALFEGNTSNVITWRLRAKLCYYLFKAWIKGLKKLTIIT